MAGHKEATASKQDKERKQKKERRHFVKQLNKRSVQEDLEIKTLDAAILAGAPAPGTNPIAADAARPPRHLTPLPAPLTTCLSQSTLRRGSMQPVTQH